VRVTETDYPEANGPVPGVGPVLRMMNVADLDALLVVQREGAVAGMGHIFPQQEYPFPINDVGRRWAQEMIDPGIDCFVILDPSNDVAGFAATRGNQFLHFGTALATWGSGLAGRAHDEVLTHLIAEGYERAWLRVFEANDRARRFYDRRGWAPTGERSQSGFPPHPILLNYQVHLGAMNG
jgi:RimJ/RimL family protein N-acetyltransferase